MGSSASQLGSASGGGEVDDYTNLTDDAFDVVSFPAPKIPLDEDGYCKSFSIDEEEDYIKFFEEYGFVIINQIAQKSDCEQFISEIWDFFEGRPWAIFGEYKDIRVNRNDSTTWRDETFPSSRVGIVGGDIANSETAWKLRQSESMYKVFSKIYGTSKLWVSLDRLGAMRPTKGVSYGKLTPPSQCRFVAETDTEGVPVQDFPKWKTAPLWPHWDLNPWAWAGASDGIEYQFDDFIQENNGSKNIGQYKLQGLISLVDSRVGDGGFCCVPGFHKHLKEYTKATKNTIYATRNKTRLTFSSVHPSDNINNQIEKISCRAGSLIIWNSELPHCNYPNDSNRWRFNFYVKMFPAHEGEPGTDFRKRLVLEYTKDVPLTEHGRRVLGLRSYDDI